MTLDQAVKEIIAATPQKAAPAPRETTAHGRQQPAKPRPAGTVERLASWLNS